MNAADPSVIWDALDARGYGPHGQQHDFRSRCPGHDGNNPTSLHVSLSASGEILLHCFAQDCPAVEIIERLGLRMADLFPSDNSYSGWLARARRENFTGNAQTVANVLMALGRLGLAWRVTIDLDECPDCESPHPALVIPSEGPPFAHCARGCGPDAMTGALAERIREEAGPMSALDDALDEDLAAEKKLDASDRKKFGGLPSWPPNDEAEPEEFARWLGAVFFTVVTGAERWGTTGDTPVTVFIDGGELRWDEQDDLQTITRLRGPLIRAGLRPRPLTPHSVGLIAWAITRLAILRADSSEKDEAMSWGASYVHERPLHEQAKTDEPQWRRELEIWQDIDDHDPHSSTSRDDRPFVLLDTDTGERYVRRGDFGAHVRSRVRGSMSWRKIAARMAEVGWQQDRLQHRATAAGAPYAGARVFVLPPAWDEQTDA